MIPPLRVPQQQAIGHALDAIRRGRPSGLWVIATGVGKTAAFLSLARQLAIPTGVLIHRENLVNQTAAAARTWWPEAKVGVVQGPRDDWKGKDLVVASVHSLGPKRLAALPPDLFGLLVSDECFPAGTLVDERPIETLKVGDWVRAWDSQAGLVVSKVEHLFVSRPSALLRITAGGRSVVCTPGHPFLTPAGWLTGGQLSAGVSVLITQESFLERSRSMPTLRETEVGARKSMPILPERSGQDGAARLLHLREDFCANPLAIQLVAQVGKATGLLFGRLRPARAGQDFRCDNDQHEPAMCFRENEGQESDGQAGMSGQGFRDDAEKWVPASGPGRQRQADASTASQACRGTGAHSGAYLQDWHAQGQRLAEPLQAGHGLSGIPAVHRSGRPIAPTISTPGTGPAERRIPAWARVDGIEVLQPGSDGTFGGVCRDGLVYNLEVAGQHTYLANGFVVHNCHRAVAKGWSRVIAHFKPGFHLGVTATPDRLDKVGLGKHFGREEPYMYLIRQAIADGVLCPVRQLAIKTGVILDGVKTNDQGAWDTTDLSRTVSAGGRNQQVVAAYQQYAAGRQAVAFAVDCDHVHALTAAFNAAGIPAVAITGENPEQRTAQLAGLASGTFQVAVNCEVLIEGADIPAVSCILWCRPTKSRLYYQQGIGRGLRLHPGKADCIAEGELVLTDAGLVPIESVTLAMKVWDGVEFVSHCGAVCRGEAEVITYAGLTATPDHKVLTEHGWKTFGACAVQQIAISAAGVGGQAIRQADGSYRGGHSAERPGVPAGGMPVRPTVGEGLDFGDSRTGWLPAVRPTAADSSLAESPSEFRQGSLHQSKKHGLPELWRPGDRVPISLAAGNGHLGARKPGASPGAAAGSDQEQRSLRAGEHQVFDGVREHEPHQEAATDPGNARIPDGSPGNPLCRLDVDPSDRPGTVLGEDCPEVPSAFLQAKRRVWDILNAGPRHRFTASGLLVSNCLIIDFVDACRLHKLVTLCNLLGIRQTDDAQGGNVIDLANAEDAERGRERERLTQGQLLFPLTWAAEEVSPWPDLPSLAGYAPGWPWQAQPASEKQLKALGRLGLDLRRDLTKGEASWLFDRAREYDFVFPTPATPAQERFLRRAGEWQDDMTKREASRLIGRLKQEVA